jgi:hypothetical protein
MAEHPKVVRPELLEDERVGIHGAVVFGRDRPGHVHKQTAMVGDQRAPGRVARLGVVAGEHDSQLRWR